MKHDSPLACPNIFCKPAVKPWKTLSYGAIGPRKVNVTSEAIEKYPNKHINIPELASWCVASLSVIS